MRHAETVTFGGSALNRAAEIRGEDANARVTHPDSRSIVLWRGKPLFCGENCDQLVYLPTSHPLFEEAKEPPVPPIFLGLSEDGSALYAHDISAWTPPELDEAQLQQFFDPTHQHHPMLPADHLFAELRGVMAHLNPRDAELAATARSIFAWHRSHRFCSNCGDESRMAQSGWQRDCPACNTSHFPRTDPVVIMLITKGNKVLMGRSPGWPEGMYSLLAGFVEPGETLEAAVRREVFEEAGVRVGAVSYLASQPWPFPSSLMFGCAGKALDDTITLDPNEIEDALWISREDMLTVFSGQHPTLKPARKGAIAHFLLRNWLADRLE
ncbi:MAG: NAD(+) diphosphatase [Shimia sp.]|jgi:NAD+ diphosphatase|uniref:NAD(+) diphosphatase n=1 Tax=Shimia sp. TaxID=1954381 RepID=UPI0025D0F485|nr:NAD(+) diphosphatase [Shimia sp.]MCH2065701.1 NAD(+) diphosphatase [Shimia sp.]